MESITLKADENLIRRIERHYDSQKIESDTFDFVAKTITCTITILNNEICFQGDDASNHAKIWSKDVDTSNNQSNDYVITMTAGHNDLFGPLVAVSCYIDQETQDYIQSLNIPTGNLSIKEIVEFTKKLSSKVKHTSSIIDNSHYNKLSEHVTKNNIRARIINDAIVKMVKETNDPNITYIIDNWTSKKTYLNYLADVPSRFKQVNVVEDLNQYQEYKVAEILSTYTYLSYLSKMQKALKIKLPQGVLKDAIDTSIIIAKKYGEASLNKVIKYNLTNIKTLKSKIES